MTRAIEGSRRRATLLQALRWAGRRGEAASDAAPSQALTSQAHSPQALAAGRVRCWPAACCLLPTCRAAVSPPACSAARLLPSARLAQCQNLTKLALQHWLEAVRVENMMCRHYSYDANVHGKLNFISCLIIRSTLDIGWM